MLVRTKFLRRLSGAGLAIAFLAGPASAEHWRELRQVRADGIVQSTFRLDLDSIRQSGDFLTYRVEVTHPNHPTRGREISYSTSTIDCRNGLRQMVSVKTVLPDGTVRTDQGTRQWRPLASHEVGFGIRNDFCVPAPAALPSR